MGSTHNPQFLLQDQAADIAVAANPLVALVDNKEFTLDIWSPSGDWGGGTVNVYMIAAAAGDSTPILLEAFTEDAIRFGEKASFGRIFKAEITGSTNPDISCAINN